MIELQITPESQRRWEELIARVEALARPDERDVRPVQEVIRAGFAFNFAAEQGGDAPWAPLSRYTVRERRYLGFEGEHPILVRTGGYRDSFIDEASLHHVSEWSSAAGLWTVEEGSSDPRADELEYGRWNMPGRPVTLLGDSGEQRIETVLDEMFGGWFDDE